MAEDAPVPAPNLLESTRAALAAMGRDATPQGLAAITAAATIVAGDHSASGLASLLREFRSAFADAVRGASSVADPIDELEARRAARVGRGA